MPALSNTRHEAFARAVATGNSRSEAYRIASGKNGTGAAELGKRWFRRVDVGLRVVELNALKNAAAAKEEAKTAAVIADKFEGQLLSMNERRAALAGIVRSVAAKPAEITAACLADAKLAGDLVDKTEASIVDKRTLTAEQRAELLAQVQQQRADMARTTGRS